MVSACQWKALSACVLHQTSLRRAVQGVWWENKKADVGGFEAEIKACTLGKVLSDALETEFADDVFLA